jgi:hypothetical protein
VATEHKSLAGPEFSFREGTKKIRAHQTKISFSLLFRTRVPSFHNNPPLFPNKATLLYDTPKVILNTPKVFSISPKVLTLGYLLALGERP